MPPMHYPKFSVSTLQICGLMSGLLHLVRRRISEGQKCYIIDLLSTEMSFKYICPQMFNHYTVVSRLARKHTQTNALKNLPRSGRPHVPSQCEDRALYRLVRWIPFANSPLLKRQWLPKTRLSARAVRHL